MTNTSISRMPNPAEFVPELNDISAALFRATGNRSVPRTTMSLVHLRAGQIVGNTYLTILMVPGQCSDRTALRMLHLPAHRRRQAPGRVIDHQVTRMSPKPLPAVCVSSAAHPEDPPPRTH